MNYTCAIENRDYSRIDKLNKLTNRFAFWDDVKKLTRNIKSDHAIGRWQCLAEIRYKELITPNQNWKEFYKRIIVSDGNVSTKDAEECGIPFEMWVQLATNRTPKGLVKAAYKLLKEMEN